MNIETNNRTSAPEAWQGPLSPQQIIEGLQDIATAPDIEEELAKHAGSTVLALENGQKPHSSDNDMVRDLMNGELLDKDGSVVQPTAFIPKDHPESVAQPASHEEGLINEFRRELDEAEADQAKIDEAVEQAEKDRERVRLSFYVRAAQKAANEDGWRTDSYLDRETGAVSLLMINKDGNKVYGVSDTALYLGGGRFATDEAEFIAEMRKREAASAPTPANA